MKFYLYLFLIFLPIVLSAQDTIIVYKTFSDFDKDKGEIHTGKLMFDGGFSGSVFEKERYIKFKNTASDVPKDSKKFKIHTGDIWGLSVNHNLFVMIDDGIPMCLLSQGKMFYYENGFAHLKMLLSKRPKKLVAIPERTSRNHNGSEGRTDYPWGSTAYFSVSINSQLIELPRSGDFKAKRLIKDYIYYFPELEEFLSCGNKFMKINFRDCVEEFNGDKLPNRRAR